MPERPATKSSKPGVQNVFWTSTTTSAMRKRSCAAPVRPCCERQRARVLEARRVVDAPDLADPAGVEVRRERKRLGHIAVVSGTWCRRSSRERSRSPSGSASSGRAARRRAGCCTCSRRSAAARGSARSARAAASARPGSWPALAPGVPFLTVELDEERAAAAAELLGRRRRTRACSRGDWRELLPAEAPFDLLFADGGQVEASTRRSSSCSPRRHARHGRPDAGPRRGRRPGARAWLRHPRVACVELQLSSRRERDRRRASSRASSAADSRVNAGRRSIRARFRPGRADLAPDRLLRRSSSTCSGARSSTCRAIKPQHDRAERRARRSAGATSPASRRRRPSCRRSSTSCATRSASSGSARACRRGSCSTARRAPARRCSRRRSRTSPARSSTRRARPRSSRCSPASAPPASASSSRRRARTRPRSSSSTSSTPSARARTGGGFHREHDQTLNQLLVELDGFGEDAQVIVMGASNRLQDLDPALLRPGRFDRQVLVSPPDLVGREADPARPHARQAARRRRRPRPDRPADRRAHRRRPGEHLQRGGDLRRPRTS